MEELFFLSIAIIALIFGIFWFLMQIMGLKMSLKKLYNKYRKKQKCQIANIYMRIAIFTIGIINVIVFILNGKEINIIKNIYIILILLVYFMIVWAMSYTEILILKEDKFIITSKFGKKEREYSLKDILSFKCEEKDGVKCIIKILHMHLKNEEEELKYIVPRIFFSNEYAFIVMLYLAIKNELEIIPNLTLEDCNRIKEEIYLKKE